MAVVEVPLLFEGRMAEMFDATVAVLAEDGLRERRAAERGTGELEGRGRRVSSARRRRPSGRPSSSTTTAASAIWRRSCGVCSDVSPTPAAEARGRIPAESPAILTRCPPRPADPGELRLAASGGPQSGRPPDLRGGASDRAAGGSSRIAALLALAVAFGISRVDFGDTIRELTLPLRHEDIIRQQAAEKGVEADLIAAVIYAESRFRDQTSNAGARGLMQITPEPPTRSRRCPAGETFEYDDLADPDLNIRYGTFFLRHLLDRYEGNEIAALAAYNAGIGNADDWGGADLERGRHRLRRDARVRRPGAREARRVPGELRQGARPR